MKASATSPDRGRISEMTFVSAEGEDDEREFAHLTEVDRWDDAGAQTLSHEESGVNVVTNRLTITKAAKRRAHPIRIGRGTGFDIPSPTKKSVTKKSRRLVTLAVTSNA